MRTRAEAKTNVTKILVTAITTPTSVKIASLDQLADSGFVVGDWSVKACVGDGPLGIDDGGIGIAWVGPTIRKYKTASD